MARELLAASRELDAAGHTFAQLGAVPDLTRRYDLAALRIGVSSRLAVLLVGFLAGAWVDRLRRRPLLMAADVLRAVLLFSIPVAYLAGVLRLEQLYVAPGRTGQGIGQTLLDIPRGWTPPRTAPAGSGS